VKVGSPYGTGSYTFPSIDFANVPHPIVDEMGQLLMEDWEGKLENRDTLADLGDADYAEYAAASFKDKFSPYGGYKNDTQFVATGYFHTIQSNNIWWIVDPEGYPFWSLGTTGAGRGTDAPTSNRTSLFPTFDDEKSSELWPMQQEQTINNNINFYDMNLIRKYGSEWDAKHAEVTMGRLKTWGMNTIGAWSDLPGDTKHPYTIIIHPVKDGIGAISKLVDPFSSTFLSSLKENLNNISWAGNDPWLLGVFVNNELHWNENFTDIPTEVLKLSNSKPARKAFEDMLEEKYITISNLNSTWGSSFTTFAAINGDNSASYTSAFTNDLNAYLDHFADTYFRVVSEECKKVFPNHLYLGSRLYSKTFGNDPVMKAASRYCDIISVNIYNYSIEDFSFATDEDKPWLISEFHFGTGTNGVWGVGLRPAFDLQNQADLYKQYIIEAASHKNFVGAHWFQWSDQPVMGRKDGENFRIGIVNITDQPYETMVNAISVTSDMVYETRLGKEINDTTSVNTR
jgi:hypothetical protein